jgi:hypothetical protein
MRRGEIDIVVKRWTMDLDHDGRHINDDESVASPSLPSSTAAAARITHLSFKPIITGFILYPSPTSTLFPPPPLIVHS